MAVFSSGHPPGTNQARRSQKFWTNRFNRSTAFETSSVRSKRVSEAIPGVVERLAGKLLLACEVPVDASFFQPRCLHEMERAAPSYPPLVEVWRRSPNDFVPGTLAFAPISLASPRNLRPTGAGRMPPNMRCDRWVTWCHNSPTEGTTNPRRRDATSRPLSERRAFQEPGHADRTRSKKRSRDDRGRVRAYCRRYLSGEISSE